MVTPNVTSPGFNTNNTHCVCDIFPVYEELSIGIPFDVDFMHLNAMYYDPHCTE